MMWIWKWLGYKDENKELIKLHQLEKAREYFAKKTKELETKHGKKGWSKSYALAVSQEACKGTKKEESSPPPIVPIRKSKRRRGAPISLKIVDKKVSI